MPKASPALTAFNSGEFSPLLAGRIDFAKYPAAQRKLRNYKLTVQGPLRQRPGSRFVATVKDEAKQVWLCRFEYNASNAYILEFGDQYVRFYTQHGQLQSAGVPVEVSTPYTLATLFNSDGTCRLRVAQSGDFLYIFHGDYEPRILQRTSATSFTLTTYRPNGGPFKDLNTTTTTVYASAATGTGITLTASSAIFQAEHVGALFLLEAKESNAIPAWEPGKSIAITNKRRVAYRNYEALDTATTGTATPVHTHGALYDGDSAVRWQFMDAGFGYVRITGFTSSTVVTADVVLQLPDQAVLVGNATTRWAFGEWNAVDGWPTDVAFFRERLVAARRSKIWLSVVNDFNDFSSRNDSGEVVADQAISRTLASGDFNDIQWLMPARDLLMGTAGGEFSLGELANGEPLGPNNVRIRVQSKHGSRAIVPIQAGAAILFVQRAGRKVREISFDAGEQGYVSTDRTALSEHIASTGFVDADYAQEPDSIAWFVTADGKLQGFTWNAEQNVWGWHPHDLDGIVESVATIPSPDGSRNEEWVVVRRTISGLTHRYIEFLEKDWNGDTDAAEDQFYVDSGLSYTGAPVTTISGLTHLLGATVSVLADGAPHPARVVNALGQITLQAAASVVHVGLPMVAVVAPMRIEGGGASGTSQGKVKKITSVVIRFHQTSSGSAGPSEDRLDPIVFRKPSDPMTAPVPPFTGDKRLDWEDPDSTDGYVVFQNDKPLQSTVVAMFPRLVTEEAD